jgi:hypothetical protein
VPNSVNPQQGFRPSRRSIGGNAGGIGDTVQVVKELLDGYLGCECDRISISAGGAADLLAETFREVHQQFAEPVARLATAAFLCGRAHAQHEASAAVPDNPAAAHELVSDPQLKEPLREIRAVANEAALQVADTLQHVVAEAYAVDLLSQWEGFHRFCQDYFGIDPLMLLRAFGLEQDDPAEELRAAFPKAAADEAVSTTFRVQWGRSWRRRFKPSA